MAEHLLKDRSTALDALSREELGIDPGELGGSAWEAAGVSFILFAIGALIPVFPLFFIQGESAYFFSVASSSFGLFLIGAAITLFTGKSVWKSGSRQLILGLAAAAITFLLGKLVGASL
jgi:VIT1/CCC1 family predicted Fe2+/Mn2+ transporter